jgi:hypothetical protein
VLIADWAALEWERRCKHAARGRKGATWSNPWKDKPGWLYEGLPKHLLLRTKVLGLNGQLARVGVPEVNPHCACGWHEQTVQHIFFGCPRYDAARLVSEARTNSLVRMLSRNTTARAAASWFAQTGLQQQFRLAVEVEAGNVDGYAPLPGLERW